MSDADKRLEEKKPKETSEPDPEKAAQAIVADADWEGISGAVEATGVPDKTIRNWLKAKQIGGRTRDGVTEVRLSDVRRLHGLKEAARAPSPTSSPSAVPTLAANGNAASGGGGGGNGGGAATKLDGNIAARVFALLEEGLDPQAIVQRERLHPQIVADAIREREALKQLGGAKRFGPTLEESVNRLAKEFLGEMFPERVQTLEKRDRRTPTHRPALTNPKRKTT